MSNQRQSYLSEICINEFGENHHLGPNLNIVSRNSYSEIEKIYKELGGKLSQIPYNFRGYDIQLRNCIIELDEQEHFNKFRLITLNSPFYKDYKNFNVDDYKNFCNQFECGCRTYGNYGDSNSSKKQFDGFLSRWRQRAFYDFIKDVYSKETNLPIIRISIYENFQGSTINELIKNKENKKLIDYIRFRMGIAFN